MSQLTFFKRSTTARQTTANERDNHAKRGFMTRPLQINNTKLALRIGSPEEHQSDAKILPLSISRDTFEHIRGAWHLPTELLRMMLSTLPMATRFSTYDDTGKSSIMGKRWQFSQKIV
jgi:hypothetical protein